MSKEFAEWLDNYNGGTSSGLEEYNSQDMFLAFNGGKLSERNECISIHDEIIVPSGVKDIDSFWSGVIAYREAIRRRDNNG